LAAFRRPMQGRDRGCTAANLFGIPSFLADATNSPGTCQRSSQGTARRSAQVFGANLAQASPPRPLKTVNENL